MDTKYHLHSTPLTLAIVLVIACQQVGAKDVIEVPADAQVYKAIAMPFVVDDVIVFRKVFIASRTHQIDRFVYGVEKQSGHKEIEDLLRQKVYILNFEYELTEAQQAKIMLAGRLEAKQFHFKVDALRRQFDAAKNNPEERQRAQQNALRLREQKSELFGADSLFAKVAGKTITDIQITQLEAAIRERLRLRHRSNIEVVIRNLQRNVVLQIPQQDALVDLMIAEIPPPQHIQIGYEEEIVRYQLARLPESQIKSLFNEDQWSIVRQCLNDFSEVGSQLEAEGKIPSFITRSVTTNEDDVQENPPADATRPESQSAPGGL